MNRIVVPAAALAVSIISAVSAAAASPPHRFSVLKPLFLTIPHGAKWHRAPKLGSPQLTQWNGSFTDHLSQTVNYTMVGTDPNTMNITTRVKVLVIPLKMVFGVANGNMTFDPLKTKTPNGRNVIKDLLRSPLFKSSVDYVQGGVDLGTTQYIDAYQRGNFWSVVQGHPNYHVKLVPQVLDEQEIDVPPGVGAVETNPFGSKPVGTMEVDVFDQDIQSILSANAGTMTPDTLPLFVSANVFLTEGIAVCCIGGYHSATAGHPSGQTYGYSTYETEIGSFSQDVSALSHEIGEWMDDPFTDNDVNCADNSLMEVGDPLENNSNYGGFPYTVNGRTYNLQSLVFIGYFGAPPSTSVNSWLSFQNDEASVCPGQ
jgi:hypothetical protein